MGTSSCYGGSHGSCYCYWLDSCDGRSYAIARITIHEASASVACVAIAAISVLDARTVTESFVDVAKYPSEGILPVIKTILRRNGYQPYSRIRTSSELNYVPSAQVVD